MVSVCLLSRDLQGNGAGHSKTSCLQHSALDCARFVGGMSAQNSCIFHSVLVGVKRHSRMQSL